MADKPILFSAPMVRALLDGRKTQTRRIIKPQPPADVVRHCWYDAPIYGFTAEHDVTDEWHKARLLAYKGDHLWVRETWWHPEPYSYGTLPSGDEIECPRIVSKFAPVHFSADGDPPNCYNRHYGKSGLRGGHFAAPDPWAVWTKRASIHMPRWASRLTLIVTDVRVERLQDISTEDAIAEGLMAMIGAPPVAVSMGCNWGFEGDTRCGSPVSAYAALWNHINGDGAWEENPFVAAYTFRVIKSNIDQIGGDA